MGGKISEVFTFCLVMLTIQYAICQSIYVKDGNKRSIEYESLVKQVHHYETGRKELEKRVNEIVEDYDSLKVRVDNHGTYLHLDDANSSEYMGGNGGDYFSDYITMGGRNITAIQLVCSPEKLHSIRVEYGDVWVSERGNANSTNCQYWTSLNRTYLTYNLSPSEYIQAIRGTNSKSGGFFVHSLTFYTNYRTLPACGDINAGGREILVNGTRVVYFSGRSGCILDGLLAHWSIY